MAIQNLLVYSILFQVVLTIILIPLDALLLMWATKMFKLSDTSYKTAFVVAVIVGGLEFVVSMLGIFVPSVAMALSVLSFIFIGVLLGAWLIKIKYKLEWGKSFLVLLVWIALSIVLALLIGFILGIILVVIGLSAFASGSAGGALPPI